jgi:hypothetical protein
MANISNLILLIFPISVVLTVNPTENLLINKPTPQSQCSVQDSDNPHHSTNGGIEFNPQKRRVIHISQGAVFGPNGWGIPHYNTAIH